MSSFNNIYQPKSMYSAPNAMNSGFQQNYTAPSQSSVALNLLTKENIQEIYKKLLGRICSDVDTNYIINLKMSESELIRRIIDSEEHLEIIETRHRFVQAEEKSKLVDIESEKIHQKNIALTHINDKLETIVKSKNNRIQELKAEIEENVKLIAKLESTIKEKSNTATKQYYSKDNKINSSNSKNARNKIINWIETKI